jgi:hypothetical protein
MPRDQLFAVRTGLSTIALVASSCAEIAIKIASHMTGEPAELLSAVPAAAAERAEFAHREYSEAHTVPPVCVVLRQA